MDQEFAKNPFTLRRAYERLEYEQKLTVMRKFNRHTKACDASGVEPDPRFLWEVIEDVKRGLEV